MKSKNNHPKKKEIKIASKQFRMKLDEAIDTLRAIRFGEVDALVVSNKKGEQIFALRGAEYRYRNMIEQMNDGAATLSLDGTILYVNHYLATLLQASADILIGSSVYQILAPESQFRFRAALQEGGQGSAKVEVMLQPNEKTLIPATLSLSLLREEDVDAICMIVTDLTEQKKTEDFIKNINKELEKRVHERTAELERKNRELDEFAYIVSHDLKEPLRGIRHYAAFLMEDYSDKLEEDGKQLIGKMEQLTNRMESLIESILNYSRKTNIDLHEEPTDLNEVLREVLQLIQINLKEQEIDIRIPQPLPTIPCDRRQIKEVFLNLINNAVKYNDKPHKWVEIGYLAPHFYVRDNGIGIPKEHHDNIFEIFKRLHGRNKFGGGTGIGLSIVKKIINRHHGHIWLESTPDKGTTFYFSLHSSQNKNYPK